MTPRARVPEAPITVDYLSGLYNRQSCYADTSDSAHLNALHIPTALERSLEKWLRDGKHVVLVGNPGDGKTHLIRLLERFMARLGVRTVLDGSQEESYPAIAKQWHTAVRAKKPFCLAINHGPLTSMLQECEQPSKELSEVRTQRSTPLYYDNPPREPERVIVIDLNLRSVLTDTLIRAAVDKLATAAERALGPHHNSEGMDLWVNLRAMTTPWVVDRVAELLTLAGHAGRHVTMRDLLGFLSYIIFGGKRDSEFGTDPYSRTHCYYNLCFEGTGTLFDSVREALQPERVTVPLVDEHLWENTGIDEGWAFGRPPETPDHLENAWELFTTLKRRFYFEHEGGRGLIDVRRDAGSSFLQILKNSERNAAAYLSAVLRSINTFFCPEYDEDGEALRLWNSQRYDNLPPHVLVSTRRVSKDKFELLVPKLPPWLGEAMDYKADHLYLVYRGNAVGTRAGNVGLRIDRELWSTLMKSKSGVPMAIRSMQHAQQLQTFIGRIQYHERNTASTAKALVYNIALTRVERLGVDGEERRFVQI